MTALRVSKLMVRRGAFSLELDSLEVSRGETLLLVGASGSGKTTVLDAIAGRAEMTGRIEIDGREVTSLPPHRRPVHTCWQSGGETLFPHMSVGENVGFALRMAGVPRASRERTVNEYLARLGLDGFARRAVPTLSGGQRQRVAVARALVHGAPVVLLDEVTNGLDPEMREELRAQLLSRQSETGAAMVCVSHDHREVEQWSRQRGAQVMVLREGRAEQCATWELLTSRPVNEFVARFVGPVNLFSGRIAAERFEAEGIGSFPRPAVGDGELYGLRPDTIRVVSPDDRAARLRGEVVRAEADRGAWDLTLRCGTHLVLVRAWSASEAFAVGRELALSWFDRDSFLTRYTE